MTETGHRKGRPNIHNPFARVAQVGEGSVTVEDDRNGGHVCATVHYSRELRRTALVTYGLVDRVVLFLHTISLVELRVQVDARFNLLAQVLSLRRVFG